MPGLERILVRLPNWLGDSLMARPALHALKGAHPRAEWTTVGPPALLELLGGEGLWEIAEPWPGESGLRARLRSARFDAALVLPPSFSSAWQAFRTGAGRRVGFAHEFRSPLLTHAPRRPARGDRHLSREYLDLVASLGAATVSVPILAPSAAAVAEAAVLLADLGGAPYSILAPGASYGPAKRWSPGRYIALGRWLAAGGDGILVCGAGSERGTCEAVAAGIGPAARSLAGNTTLPAQAGLCARSRLAVCNDSGLAHLAAATGAPTIVIFGSTSSAWSAPLGPRVRVVQRAPVCSPCFARTCAIGYPCLEAVEVGMVEDAAREWAA